MILNHHSYKEDIGKGTFSMICPKCQTPFIGASSRTLCNECKHKVDSSGFYCYIYETGIANKCPNQCLECKHSEK